MLQIQCLPRHISLNQQFATAIQFQAIKTSQCSFNSAFTLVVVFAGELKPSAGGSESEFSSLHAVLDELKEGMVTRIKQERASRTYELQVRARDELSSLE